MMSGDVASLKVAGRQLLLFPLTPSTPVINSWSRKQDSSIDFREDMEL